MQIDFNLHRKILIIRLGKIGDIVTTSFVSEIIRANYINAEVYLLTLSMNKDVLICNPSFNKIFYSHNLLTLLWKVWILNFYKFDVILDFNDNPSTTSVLLFRYVRAKFKVGYNFKKYSQCINVKVEQLVKENSHIIDRIKYFLEQVGIPIDEKLVRPYFYLEPKVFSYIKNELERIQNSKNIVTINLSAGNKIRYWEIDKWIDLINRIVSEFPNCLIILLNVKTDIHISEQILAEINAKNIIKGNNESIQHLASYIKLSDLVITPDTSAVHISSALNIPVIALYPNYQWNFVSWQPYKVPFRAVQSLTESIKTIPVKEVWNEFQQLVYELNILKI